MPTTPPTTNGLQGYITISGNQGQFKGSNSGPQTPGKIPVLAGNFGPNISPGNPSVALASGSASKLITVRLVDSYSAQFRSAAASRAILSVDILLGKDLLKHPHQLPSLHLRLLQATISSIKPVSL
jgi:hypothetical protein